jgi:3-oxoacyl-[acyl-carrier protein] reductase
MRLKDKVAIVTGGAAGIGKAITRGLADEGAAVVVNYRSSRQAAETIVSEIEAAGGRALSFQADVSQADQVEAMVACAMKTFGRIDILVNNAAVLYRNKAEKVPVWEMSPEEWNKVIEVNLTGVFLCCRAVLPHMIPQQSGKIINIGSGHGLIGVANFAHYVACKGAVMSFTKGLAKETGKYSINVNCLAAGSILSEDNPDDPEVVAFRQAAVASSAIKRIGYPQDLLGCVKFLASSDSDFVTGQTIVVDGGAVMH